MICPRCRAEYRPGFTVCADCGVALVEEIDPAAVVEAEVSTALEPFHETWSPDELGMLLELFEERSIAYVVQAGTALSMLTQEMAAEELPEEWHARILVAGPHMAHAKQALRELRQVAAQQASGRGGGAVV